MKAPTMLGVARSADESVPTKRKTRSRDEVIEDAHAAKRHATASWIEGHISDEEHRLVHAKANHVIKHKGKI